MPSGNWLLVSGRSVFLFALLFRRWWAVVSCFAVVDGQVAIGAGFRGWLFAERFVYSNRLVCLWSGSIGWRFVYAVAMKLAVSSQQPFEQLRDPCAHDAGGTREHIRNERF